MKLDIPFVRLGYFKQNGSQMIQNFGTLIRLDRCTCCLCSHGMQELAHSNYGESVKQHLNVAQLCSAQPLRNYWINEECTHHPWL